MWKLYTRFCVVDLSDPLPPPPPVHVQNFWAWQTVSLGGVLQAC